jgi:cytochrome c oxidase cbb3-type subunit 2
VKALLFPLAGLALLIGASVLGLVVAPVVQLSRLEAVGTPRSALAERGARIYCAEGCAECHTQQLRPVDVAEETARGWGPRRTVPRDLARDAAPVLGTLRIGPDLANEGKRHDAAWQLRHLDIPSAVVPGSLMPSYAFLFEKRGAGEGSVPTAEAEALVAYLLSLDQSAPLPEAKR